MSRRPAASTGDASTGLSSTGFSPAGEPSAGESASTRSRGGSDLVRVAVPLPLPETLTYRVPPRLAPLTRPGCRVRVTVGKRRLTGMVMAPADREPAGVRLRDIESIVDLEPVLPESILELAAFVSEYYMAPPGEVARALLPAGLPPWGQKTLRLTDGGALATLADPGERSVVEWLRDRGASPTSEILAELGVDVAAGAVERLQARGLLVATSPPGQGSRYATAVELAPGDLDGLLEACGRSAPARRVVEYLHAVGRPATTTEVVEAGECGKGVIRRLVGLGVLRSFTQLDRLPLDRHLARPVERHPIVLRPDQSEAVERLTGALAAGRYAPFLLAGVTGSGKTEVYLRVVEQALAGGGGSILLVPEISLVPALARTVRQRFGDRLAILHSGLARAERQQEWERIRSGRARVVLGPRSAIFAPVRDLAFIAVDEEQDASYKQESSPRYHGRDVALVRARAEGAVAVLISATPSLESRLNAQRGRLERLELTERVGQGSLPEGVLVDLRTEPGPRRPGEITFSARLLDEIETALSRGHQIILLRNRRGYAPILLCRACGHDHPCDDCGLPRTLHQRPRRLLCHYCGSVEPVRDHCAKCGETALEAIGTGTERVEERFQELFPGVPVDLLDRDAVRRVGSTKQILDRFADGETRVLIGTQMVSKGHHFPGVALTAVLHADAYLSFPDFRAVERTYSLLTQLAGRAGRGEVAGKVVIQTYHPEHYAIRAALAHDDAAFAEQEMRFRRIFHYPPYTRMTQVLLRDRRRNAVETAARRLAERLHEELAGAPEAAQVRVNGPAPAAFERLRGKWRYQILVRSRRPALVRAAIERATRGLAGPDIVLDVDPYQLL
jgi:primosomal protein N' (replication factor Y)